MRNELTVAVEVLDVATFLDAAAPDRDNELTGFYWEKVELQVLTTEPNFEIDVAAPVVVENVWVNSARFEQLRAASVGGESRLVGSIGPTTTWRDWWFMGFATVGESDSLDFTDACSAISVKQELVEFQASERFASELAAFAAFDLTAASGTSGSAQDPLPGVFAEDGSPLVVAVDFDDQSDVLVCFAQDGAAADRTVCLAPTAVGAAGGDPEIRLTVTAGPLLVDVRRDTPGDEVPLGPVTSIDLSAVLDGTAEGVSRLSLSFVLDGRALSAEQR